MIKKLLWLTGIIFFLFISLIYLDNPINKSREVYSNSVDIIISKINRPPNSSKFLQINMTKPIITDVPESSVDNKEDINKLSLLKHEIAITNKTNSPITFIDTYYLSPELGEFERGSAYFGGSNKKITLKPNESTYLRTGLLLVNYQNLSQSDKDIVDKGILHLYAKFEYGNEIEYFELKYQ